MPEVSDGLQLMGNFYNGVTVVIPARKGSKGVVFKNKRLLMGKPLVLWSILLAKKLKSVGAVVVSTDDDDIIEMATAEGVYALKRSAELSSDEAKSCDVVEDALLQLQKKGVRNELLLLLEPTSPFRDAQKIERAVEKIRVDGFDSVVGMVQVSQKPQNIFDVSTGVPKRLVNLDENIFHQRQGLLAFKRISGNFYLTKTENFFRTKRFIDGALSYIENSGHEAINIDSEDDLVLAEIYAQKLSRVIF